MWYITIYTYIGRLDGPRFPTPARKWCMCIYIHMYVYGGPMSSIYLNLITCHLLLGPASEMRCAVTQAEQGVVWEGIQLQWSVA